jgi:1,4-alpha-glucan branching enzyme
MMGFDEFAGRLHRMADNLGSLCIVLHGHLPYVLHHGVYPHGENWLFEAAAETYLPILDIVGAASLHNIRSALTVGMTPVLLEQLAHPRFKNGFVAYLNSRIDRANQDRKEFESKNQLHFAYLAQKWAQWYGKQLEHFERIKRDIPAEFGQRFREGQLQVLTSNATHCYMPLVLNDEMLAAQMKVGTRTSKKHLGVAPRGMWLPECAYRPEWQSWNPSVLYDNPRHRVGVENFIAAAGVTHFFVDTHLITGGNVMGTFDNQQFKAGNDDMLAWDRAKGWREPMEPVGVVSWQRPPDVFAFARHPRVSEQVWSGSIGYPGDGVYLEFHRKNGEKGLRYHKVTSTKTALSDKDPYYPDDIPGTLFKHAQHFANVVKDTLREYRNRTGRRGVVVAPFDAELFGHWWFEGPQFLRDVIFTLANDPEVTLRTAEEALYHHAPDKVMRMPEGSWGEKGNHSVWINERNRWYWEMEYRAEGRMLKLLYDLPWKTNPTIKSLLEKCARQLLLLQGSDWAFVIHSYGAVDYGIQRISGHATRFDRLTLLAEKVAAGHELDETDKIQIAEADAHDVIFQDIDLTDWMK